MKKRMISLVVLLIVLVGVCVLIYNFNYTNNSYDGSVIEISDKNKDGVTNLAASSSYKNSLSAI